MLFEITFIPVVESLTENERNSLGQPEITKGIKQYGIQKRETSLTYPQSRYFYHESILSIQIQLKNKN